MRSLALWLEASANNREVQGSCLRHTDESQQDETGLWLASIERGDAFSDNILLLLLLLLLLLTNFK